MLQSSRQQQKESLFIRITRCLSKHSDETYANRYIIVTVGAEQDGFSFWLLHRSRILIILLTILE